MDNIVLTLLDKEDALANENKLKCFKKYGITAGYTDVFSLTGGKTTLEKMTRIPDEFGLKNRTAPYAFNTVLKDESVFAIDETGNKTSVKENDTTFGIRPTIITFDSLFHTLIKNPYIGYNGVEEIEFGEYPQYASAHKVNIALEDEYSNNLENGKKYHVEINSPEKLGWIDNVNLVITNSNDLINNLFHFTSQRIIY